MNPETITKLATRNTLSQLSNEELARLRNAYEWNSVAMLEKQPAYHKVKELFTEQDGTKMHPLVFATFDAYVVERLGGTGT